MSQLEFTPEELKAFRAEYTRGATDSQFDLFIAECKARSLRPGTHLVFQLRNSKEWDPTTGASVYVKKPYWITTISALLLVAERTGKYDGASSPEYIYLDDTGNPTVVSDIPLPDKQNKSLPREPWAVRVKVRRKDFSEPITSVVRFDSVAATQKRDNGIVLTEMWQKRGPEQNAKCSLANAIRLAFPENAGQLFLTEELKNEAPEEEKPLSVTPASVVSMPVSAPAVDQTPATPTDTPRPNEVKTEYHVTSVPATLPEHSGNVLVVKPDTKAVEAAKKAVPDIKTASEIKPKRGRKPNPVNGQDLDPGITDEDIASISQPAPEVNKEEIKKGAEEFVASADPTPTKEEQADFTARVRVLTAAGVASLDLKNYILKTGGKTDTKQLTVRDWRTALETLETAHKEGRLKEITKAQEAAKDAF